MEARANKGGDAARGKANSAEPARGDSARSHPAGTPDVAAADQVSRLSAVRLLALDIDGVLTDGSIAYGAYGPADQLQRFNVQDGLALRWIAKAGVKIAWISGRGCVANMQRARELEIDELFEKVADKGDVLREIQDRLSISRDETAAMGDDLPDLALRGACGFFAAPANAVADVKERADLVTRSSGGDGAVRELCEAILRAKGRWQAILDAAVR